MDGAVHQVDDRSLAELYGKPTLVAVGHDGAVVASAEGVVLSNRLPLPPREPGPHRAAPDFAYSACIARLRH
jgi:hypothetical protein